MTAVGAVWGFAEATLFFIVPDVWLSVVAFRHGPGRAVVACIPTTVGALAGGVLMFLWGTLDPQAARPVLDMIPAIGERTIDSAREALAQDGLIAMAVGAFSGVPFKIFASQAPAAGISLAPFLAVALAARMARFLIVAVFAGWIGRELARRAGARRALWLLAGFWVLFYGFYWTVAPG